METKAFLKKLVDLISAGAKQACEEDIDVVAHASTLLVHMLQQNEELNTSLLQELTFSDWLSYALLDCSKQEIRMHVASAMSTLISTSLTYHSTDESLDANSEQKHWRCGIFS